MSERSLSVQVAEALGCTPSLELREWWCRCDIRAPHGRPEWGGTLLDYEHDWSALGPVVEQKLANLTLTRDISAGPLPVGSYPCMASVPGAIGYGQNYSDAICRLLIGMAKTGESNK